MINAVDAEEHLAEEQETGSLAREKAERHAEEAKNTKDTKQASKDMSSELYVGDVQLVLSSHIDFHQLEKFEECLERAESLRLVWSGGSVNKGTIIAISAHEPVPLINILKEIPLVEKVDKKGKKIMVVLKALTF